MRDLERGSKPLLKDKKRLVMLVKEVRVDVSWFVLCARAKNIIIRKESSI